MLELAAVVAPSRVGSTAGVNGAHDVGGVAMLAALIANLFLLGSPIYLGILCIQLTFYLVAGAGSVWRLRPKALMLPFYFCMINLATFFGFYHALTQRRTLAWK